MTIVTVEFVDCGVEAEEYEDKWVGIKNGCLVITEAKDKSILTIIPLYNILRISLYGVKQDERTDNHCK